jgi:hypothetical protein
MNGYAIKGANGQLPISLGWEGANCAFTVTGGPYDKYPGPQNAFGVCVRAENAGNLHKDVWLKIKDFNVPTDDLAVHAALRQTLSAALTGKDVYIGCQGGWGRTGLFLALLAKTCGVENPIMYVRQNYARTAVETPAQEKYVRDFDVTPTRIWLFWYAWTGRIGNAMFWWRR